MPLDPTKLVGARRAAGKTTAQCPACAAAGQDGSQNHLVLFDSGKFGCVVDTSPEHSREIWQLAGTDATGEATYTAPEEPKVEIPRIWPPELLARLIQDGSYWNGRGISDETLAPYRGGVATHAQMADRYVFPQFNADGEIIGFSGRCLRKMSLAERKLYRRPKWKHLSHSSTYLWGGLDEVAETRRAVLVESIGDSLKLREHGVPESICIFGTVMSEVVLGYLISTNPTEIIVSTNLDEPKMMNGRMKWPGQEAAVRIKRTLDAFFDEGVARIMHPSEALNDWGDATAEQIHTAFLAPAAPVEDIPPASAPEITDDLEC